MKNSCAMMSIFILFISGFASGPVFGGDGLFIDQSGKAGLGTTSPKNKLHVEGPNYASGSIRINNTANSGGSTYWEVGERSYSSTDSNFEINANGIARLTMDENGRVGIGTKNPEATLHVNGNAVISGTLNGEDPPIKFTVGNPHEQSAWLAVEKNVESHCGDDDGCRIRLLLQHETNDIVKTVSADIYIEQPSISNKKEPGLRGWTRMGASDISWILGWSGHLYSLCSPYDWIWIRNFRHEYAYGTRGPAYAGEDIYKLNFQVHPYVTATVIIYDR